MIVWSTVKVYFNPTVDKYSRLNEKIIHQSNLFQKFDGDGKVVHRAGFDTWVFKISEIIFVTNN